MAVTLVTEDGTGKSDANTLFDLSDVDGYLANRDPTWAALADDERKRLIVVANDYLLQAYSTQWSGSRQFAVQALDWPRWGAEAHGFCIDQGTVPPGLLPAVALLANKARTTVLLPDQDNSGKIASESVTAGPVSTSTSYTSAGATPVPIFHDVEGLLAPWLDGTNAMGLWSVGIAIGGRY